MRPGALFWNGLVAAALLLALPADARRGFRIGGRGRTGGGSWGGSTGTGSFGSYTPPRPQIPSTNLFDNFNRGSTWRTHTSANPYSRLFGDSNTGSYSWNAMSNRQPKGNWDWMKAADVSGALSPKPKALDLSVPVFHHYKHRHGWRGKVGGLFETTEENGRTVVVMGSPPDPPGRRPVCYGSSCSSSACEVVCTALSCNVPPLAPSLAFPSRRCNFTCVATTCTGAEGLLNSTRKASTPSEKEDDSKMTESKPDCALAEFCNVTEATVACDATGGSCNASRTAASCDEEDKKCNLTLSPAGCSSPDGSCNKQQLETRCNGYEGSCNFTCSAVPCNDIGGFCNFTCPAFPCNVNKNIFSCFGLYLNVTVESQRLSNFTCKSTFCSTLFTKSLNSCYHSCIPDRRNTVTLDEFIKNYEERRLLLETLSILAFLEELESKSNESATP